MSDDLGPLRPRSLVQEFVERFEGLILSGRLPVGHHLPSERDLAARLGVSRPVVHEGLVELAARGLVQLRPRRGAVVADFRREASFALFDSMVRHLKGHLAPDVLDGLIEVRRLCEVQGARLAARRGNPADLDRLRDALAGAEDADPADPDALSDADTELHRAVALASGNPVLPMLLKSLEPADRAVNRLFYFDLGVVAEVRDAHARLVEAIAAGDEHGAARAMEEVIEHRRTVLLGHASFNDD